MLTKFDSVTAYFDEAQKIIDCLRSTQIPAIEQAAQVCIDTIANHRLVHLFGTGHSRIPVEEFFPRHGSFPGFHPIVELSMTNHTQVVGPNGQRQAMFIEKIEGFGEVILNNFFFHDGDCMIIFSHSGVNNVVIDVALGAKERNLPLIAVVSVDHCKASKPKHSSGKRIIDIADIVIDNCTPKGDALVSVDGLEYPVGPGSTIGFAYIVNALKVATAEGLTELGKPPLVLTSGVLIGDEASRDIFERTYDDYRERMAQVYQPPTETETKS